ncbi:MAG TPA: MASE1 domain-containing protein [Chthonomonadaceae bacterium]|nr:MASE1 domain-containing protein [Chthonomonadaceae bacterium]
MQHPSDPILQPLVGAAISTGSTAKHKLLVRADSPTYPSVRLLACLAEILVLTGLYYGAARLGLLLAFRQTNDSPVCTPTGLAFAAILLRGYRVWPGILLGAFLANAAVFHANHAADTGTIAAMSAAIAVGNTLEAVLGAWLLQRCVGDRRPLERAEDVVKFLFVTALMCLTSSAIGVTTLLLSGIIPRAVVGTIWFTWWLGDVMGALVVTPLLLTAPFSRSVYRSSRTLWEAALFLALLIGTGEIIFGGGSHVGTRHDALAFTLIPYVIWAAFRFGQQGVTLATASVTGMAVWGTIHGYGPFVNPNVNESLLLLQIFVGIVTVTGWMLAATLTERKRAEEALHRAHVELERRAVELEAANKELEGFAYSVSHDLRAPLRASDGFSRILLEAYAPQLSPEVQRYLGLVRSNTQQMGQLVDDLLRFSRLSRQALERRSIAMTNLVRQCLDDLALEQEGRQVQIILGDMPVCQADQALLKQVLLNLLSNALKYTRQREEAVIEIGAQTGGETSGACIYFVKDNGVGFNMKYAHKLFGVFQRLHRAEEYEGTGVGLAIVQRILSRHGGRVWADAEVGKGATFFFTLEGANPS